MADEVKFSEVGDPNQFTPSALPDGISEGDVITVEGYYEPHVDPRHVYTKADILILWRVEGTQLIRIPPPRKIPRSRKRLMEEKPWWDEWHQFMVRKWSQVRPSDLMPKSIVE